MDGVPVERFPRRMLWPALPLPWKAVAMTTTMAMSGERKIRRHWMSGTTWKESKNNGRESLKPREVLAAARRRDAAAALIRAATSKHCKNVPPAGRETDWSATDPPSLCVLVFRHFVMQDAGAGTGKTRSLTRCCTANRERGLISKAELAVDDVATAGGIPAPLASGIVRVPAEDGLGRLMREMPDPARESWTGICLCPLSRALGAQFAAESSLSRQTCKWDTSDSPSWALSIRHGKTYSTSTTAAPALLPCSSWQSHVVRDQTALCQLHRGHDPCHRRSPRIQQRDDRTTGQRPARDRRVGRASAQEAPHSSSSSSATSICAAIYFQLAPGSIDPVAG